MLITSAIGIGYSAGSKFLIIGFKFIEFYRQIVPLLLLIAAIMIVGGGLANLSLNWILTRCDKLTAYKLLSAVVAVVGMIILPFSIFETGELGFYVFAALVLSIGVISSPILTIDSFFLKDLVIYVRKTKCFDLHCCLI